MRVLWLAWLLLLHISVVSASADDNVEKVDVRVLRADLVDDNGTVLASVDVGDATPGERIKLDLRLHNSTQKKVAFDDVVTSCSCQDLSPKSGIVGPGGTLKIALTVRTPDIPLHRNGGGRISFKNSGTPVFNLAFEYSFAKHAGFRDNLISLKITDEQRGKEIKFPIPVVLGKSVSSDQIDFDLDGIEASFSWENGVLNHFNGPIGKIKFPESQRKFNRLFGTLNLVRLDGGTRSSVPLVIELEDSLQIVPSVLRFDAPRDDGVSMSALYVVVKAPEARRVKLEVTCGKHRASRLLPVTFRSE